MKRKDFLKRLLVIPAIPAIPSLLKKTGVSPYLRYAKEEKKPVVLSENKVSSAPAFTYKISCTG